MENEEQKRKTSSVTFRVLKTVCLVCTWIAMGLFLEITGPTLQDLKWRANTDYESIARAVAGRSAGDMVGALIGGFLVDKIGHYSDLIIGVCLICAASATVSVPWAQQIEVVWMLILIQGLSEVIINVCGNKLILEMWLVKASAPMHALHLGFGIGSFLIPLIANPFLAVKAPADDKCAFFANFSINNETTSLPCHNETLSTEIPVFKTESRIEYAYLIAATPALVFACIFISYQFYSRPHSSTNLSKQERKPLKKIINPASCANGHFCFGLTIYVLMFLQFFSVVGGERLFGKFIRAYSIDHVRFSKNAGSYINTVFWVAFSAGRFTGFAVGRWIPIRMMLMIESSCIFLSTLVLAVLGHINPEVMLWICTGLVGFFTGPLFPTSMTWTDYHVELTGMGITVNCLGGGVGGIVFLWVMGYFYEHYGPQTFPYEVLAYGILTLILSVTLHFVGKTKGGRFDKEKKDVTDPT